MPQAVIFDFDGVLVDSEPLHYRAFLRTAKQAGLGVDFDYAQYLDRYVGYDDRDGFRAMLADAGRSPRNGDAAIEALCRAKQGVFDSIVAQGVAAVPGVIALLDSVPKRVPVAIASGATRRDIDLVLAALGLTGRFEVIVSATDVARSKPDPQTYRVALAALAQRWPKLSMPPQKCLAIEDTPTGIASARGAGLTTLAVTTTTASTNLLDAHRVTETLEGVTYKTLCDWFG